MLLALAVTAVLGQQDPQYSYIDRPIYRPQNEPDDYAQERAFLDYYYSSISEEDYPVPSQSVNRNHARHQPQGPPTNINTFYQTNCMAKKRTLPHEKYCDHFYQLNGCDNDQAILQLCPNGLVYTGNGRHGLIGVCDYPHKVDCNGHDRHNPPIITEHCDWLYGIFGHETSCTRYWTCWNGTATEQFCIGGLFYNEETHACDWPQNVGGCQKHPLCKDDPNGNVPLGKSCNRYWACQGGYPRLQRCPVMLVFDKDRKRCVSPPTADCDVPVTTPQPDEDDNTGGRGRPNDNRGGNPENRRRFQTQAAAGPSGARPNQGPPQGLPFNLPEGAQILARPPQQ